MPTIAKLEIIPLIYRVPEGRAYGMARGLTPIRQASLVNLTTDDGGGRRGLLKLILI